MQLLKGVWQVVIKRGRHVVVLNIKVQFNNNMKNNFKLVIKSGCGQ